MRCLCLACIRQNVPHSLIMQAQREPSLGSGGQKSRKKDQERDEPGSKHLRNRLHAEIHPVNPQVTLLIV